MKLSFGSVERPGDEILSVQVHDRRVLGRLRRNADIHHRWVVTGRIIADSQSSLEEEMEDIESIFYGGSSDLSFENDSGDAIEGHSLDASETKYGIYCVERSWMPTRMLSQVPGSGAEFQVMKGYRLTFQAESEEATDSNIVEWRETLQQFGSGEPLYNHATAMTGTPQAQTPIALTPIRIVQQGISIGLESYVDFPAPIYAGKLNSPLYRIGYESPMYFKNKDLYFPRNWTYVSSHSGTSDIPAGTLQKPTF